MRHAILLAGAMIVAPIDAGLAATPYDGPWCMHMTMGWGSIVSRCDMRSYEMCRSEMRSLGGTYCTENPYYWWDKRKAKPASGGSKRRNP